MRFQRRLASLVLPCLLVGAAPGCHTQVVQRPQTEALHAVEVTAENVTDIARELDETAPGTRGREALRDGVARYLARQGVDALQSGDFDGAMLQLRAALVHFTPDEIAHAQLPNEIGPLARAIYTVASSRGDEPRALAAARVLRALRTPDPDAEANYHRIDDWGTRNRREFMRGPARAAALAELYREVARVVPAPDVLDRAAEEIIERRRAAAEARRSPDAQRLPRELLAQLELWVRGAPVELTILYLRVGQIAEAANRVTALGEGDSRLASVLGAIAQGDGGADGLWELAQRLQETDLTAFEGVCRVGRRQFSTDVRFAQGLAIAAGSAGQLGLASAHLVAAVGLAPRDQRTARLAIETTASWLSRELGADDVAPGRSAYARTITLLEQWQARWPTITPPVASADLEELAAQLELTSGNLSEARAHLERATHATPASREAYLTLGEIAWRQGDGTAAMRHYEAGVALPLRPSESDSLFRPKFMVREAQALAGTTLDPEARRRFEEAGRTLEALARNTSGAERADTELQRATVSDALGDAAQVHTSLVAALDADPDNRDIAARAVTFALSRGLWREARDLDRRARSQLTLDRPWQVYFGLWGVAAAALGGLEDDGGARQSLTAVTAGAGDMSAWQVRLAQRYTGGIEREALLGYARTPGQRAEAHFYEALLSLSTGDAAGAARDLQATIATDVLRYFEYEMAWEMARRHPVATPAAAPTPTAAAPTPTAAAPSPTAAAGTPAAR